jgi:hypothetical protein
VLLAWQTNVEALIRKECEDLRRTNHAQTQALTQRLDLVSGRTQ